MKKLGLIFLIVIFVTVMMADVSQADRYHRGRPYYHGSYHHGIDHWSHRGYPGGVSVRPFHGFRFHLSAPMIIHQPPIYVHEPTPVYVQRPAPVYVEQAQDDSSYWYYCDNPEGYYPYIKTCPGGWMKVVPQTVPPNQ